MCSERTILAVIDPKAETQRTLERAARLAKLVGLPLELLVVVYDQFVDHDSEAKESLLARRRDGVRDLADWIRNDIADIRVTAKWGRPLADIIIERAKAANAAFVVKDTQHHSAFGRTLLSSADWDLIRHCPAPLLLVKDRDLPTRPNFLAAIDPAQDHGKPGSLDRKILGLGKRLSDKTGGRLIPLHVLDSALFASIEPLVAAPGAYGAAALVATHALPAEEIEQIKQERKELVDELLDDADLASDAGVLLVGDPAATLVGTAERRDVDFVIMGAVARGILDRILIGHTAEKILDRLPCDLIVVKPESAAN